MIISCWRIHILIQPHPRVVEALNQDISIFHVLCRLYHALTYSSIFPRRDRLEGLLERSGCHARPSDPWSAPFARIDGADRIMYVPGGNDFCHEHIHILVGLQKADQPAHFLCHVRKYGG